MNFATLIAEYFRQSAIYVSMRQATYHTSEKMKQLVKVYYKANEVYRRPEETTKWKRVMKPNENRLYMADNWNYSNKLAVF